MVVAVGCEVSSFANSWLGMLGMFVIGPAHEARPLCLAHLCVKIREEVGESLAKQSLESTVGVSFGICSGFVRDARLSRFFYNAKLLHSDLAVIRFYTIPAIE